MDRDASEEGGMRIHDEGLAAPQVPVRRRPAPERPRAAPPRHGGSLEPRCEMCGSPVIATHCKRICLKCGFMTGCSEGI